MDAQNDYFGKGGLEDLMEKFVIENGSEEEDDLMDDDDRQVLLFSECPTKFCSVNSKVTICFSDVLLLEFIALIVRCKLQILNSSRSVESVY